MNQVRGIQIFPLRSLPMFRKGDHLAGMIGEALVQESIGLAAGDILVVAQKIVSKVEGRAVDLATVEAGEEATRLAGITKKDPRVVELVISESEAVVRAVPGVLITRHRSGHVLANAGVDASNIGLGKDVVLLWPLDPDASARSLREALEERFGVRIGVLISDSLGRAWRLGTAGTAIGLAGVEAIIDRRGQSDLFGRTLEATIIGMADQLAAAAALAIGEAAEGIPVALIRGAPFAPSDAARGSDLLRPLGQDLFQ
jgi:coenzyme F420-0:L-glutamate ligase/coenzyme F420-1:gamma-L-glutamate ligase